MLSRIVGSWTKILQVRGLRQKGYLCQPAALAFWDSGVFSLPWKLLIMPPATICRCSLCARCYAGCFICCILFNIYIIILESNSFYLHPTCKNRNLEKVTPLKSQAGLGFDLRLVWLQGLSLNCHIALCSRGDVSWNKALCGERRWWNIAICTHLLEI